MSTNSRPTTESQTTTPARTTPANAASAEATTETTSDDADSWVKRCQRQFDAHRMDRLRNLADEENQAMLD